jgi:SAM-dependent methyltransferase
MIHHNSCPLCASQDISHFLNCIDHLVTNEEFEICKCGNCGFAFTQDHPEEPEAGHYYESEDYISHSNTKKGITDRAYQVVRNIMLRKKMKLVGKMAGLTAGKLLDIGSATGHFLNIMKLSGWDVKGIEINKKAREYSVNSFNAEALPPENIDTLPDASFDCITLWHVLEHFHEPFKYMDEIRRLLKPGGLCFIALPDSGSFDCRHYREDWAAYDVPRHLWHFNRSTFSLFAGTSNFKINAIRNLPFDVFYISILSEKYKGTLFPVFSGLLNGVIFSLKSAVNRRGFSSVIYILRKSDS